MQVALEIGLFKMLSKTPITSEQLAHECRCSPRGLRPLLYLLSSLDLIRETAKGFVSSPVTKSYLKNRWRREWEAFPVIPEYELLGQAVRTGRPIRPPVEGSDDEGEFFSNIVPALFELHLPDAQHLAGQLPIGLNTVLDLGAGSAVWSLPLATARPEVRVVAVDRAKVLRDVTSEYLQKHGVSDRYELRAGSYHDVELPAETFDLVYLGHLLHADGWELSRHLLARAYAALVPGGYLVIAEIVGTEPRSLDYPSNVFDLNMLMLTEAGLVFTRNELQQLVGEAGFACWEWVQGPGDYPVLLARKGE